MIPDELQINSFLRFGYFGDYEKKIAPIDFSGLDKSLYEGKSRNELIEIGEEKLRETFASLFQIQRENVVPLSGGLDSRLILGALLELMPAERIHTYTYGVPGSYDYEIANLVAKKFGTRHTKLPLNAVSYSMEDELGAACRTDCQGVLFYHPPLDVLDRLYPNAVFWSGYVGDAVAGSFLNAIPSETIVQAQVAHMNRRNFVRSMRLHSCEDQEFIGQMGAAFIDSHLISFDEQVLFSEAVPKFTAPLVLFSGFDYVTPFINTPWMDFMFSVPNKFRLDQALMIDICRSAYVRLFQVPTKNRLGHTFESPDVLVAATFWLNRFRKALHQFVPIVNWPNVQYNDFDEGVRSDKGLRELVRQSITDLRSRGICDWVDFDGIWRRHNRRIRNHGDALIVLASLELVLRAREGGCPE